MPILNIITAVSRPENLYILKAAIEKEILPYFETTWYCIYDPRMEACMINFIDTWIISMQGGIPNDISGASQRNKALDLIESGWNWCLDDDNLPYPGFGKAMKKNIDNNPGINAFVFNQRTSSGVLFASIENIKMGSIDVAQIFFERKMAGRKRFFSNVYESDYYFIKRIYRGNESRFMFINEDLCYYNFLKQ